MTERWRRECDSQWLQPARLRSGVVYTKHVMIEKSFFFASGLLMLMLGVTSEIEDEHERKLLPILPLSPNPEICSKLL